MADKLRSYFEAAQREFGGIGRVKFALLTKMSSTKAGVIEDTPEKLESFERAMEQLRVEIRSKQPQA